MVVFHIVLQSFCYVTSSTTSYALYHFFFQTLALMHMQGTLKALSKNAHSILSWLTLIKS